MTIRVSVYARAPRGSLGTPVRTPQDLGKSLERMCDPWERSGASSEGPEVKIGEQKETLKIVYTSEPKHVQ